METLGEFGHGGFFLLSKIRPLWLALKENLLLYFGTRGGKGLSAVAFLSIGPLVAQEGPAGGQPGGNSVLSCRRQWLGLGLGTAVCEHRPFHQDFFHAQPRPLAPPESQM